ncbi:MAG: mandelate racemase/muconate lactonizing enzyme family protein, partial [Ilumatobacteraceae bacterium]|nr:mandelate racemase/muconate lactonizing enzyme family protein [Ilumatobacteraceae bacterium]
MKVESIRTIPVTFGTDREQMSFLFVEVVADDGTVGWGEVCDSYGCSYATVVATAIDDVLAPLLVGHELRSVDPHAERLRLSTRRRLGDSWVGAQARAGVEVALWDLLATARGASVSELIGRVRDDIEVYASCGFLEEGDADHHLATIMPLVDRGVRKVKLRTGPDWSADLPTLAAIRARLGDGVELMIDASETYTVATARRLAERLAELDVRWIEEPIPQGSRAGIEAFVAASPVPVAYGEHLFTADEAVDAMRRRQLDILQPDASTAGISEARRMALAAAGFGVRVVPHVCAGPVSLAANLQLAATVPAIGCIEYPPSLLHAWDELGAGAPLTLDAIDGGRLRIPDSPGLGVDLDVAVAAAHPYQPLGTRVAGTTAGLPD